MRVHFGTHLWVDVGAILGQLLGRFWDDFGPIFGPFLDSFLDDFGILLGLFRDHLGTNSGRIRLRRGSPGESMENIARIDNGFKIDENRANDSKIKHSGGVLGAQAKTQKSA